MALLTILTILSLSSLFALTTAFPTPSGFSADITTRDSWECDPTICDPVDPGLGPVIVHPDIIPKPIGPICDPRICDPPAPFLKPDLSISDITDDGLHLDLDIGDLGKRTARDEDGDSTAPEPVTGDWLKVKARDENGEAEQVGSVGGVAQFDGYEKKKLKRDVDGVVDESVAQFDGDDGTGSGGGPPPFTPVKRNVDGSESGVQERDENVSGGRGSEPSARFGPVKRAVDESGSNDWSGLGNGIVIGSKEKAKRWTEGEAEHNGNWVGNGAKVERDGTLPLPSDGSGEKGKRESIPGEKRHWGVGNGLVADEDGFGNGVVIGSRLKEKRSSVSVSNQVYGDGVNEGIVIKSKLKEKRHAGLTSGDGAVAEDFVDGTEIGNGIVIERAVEDLADGTEVGSGIVIGSKDKVKRARDEYESVEVADAANESENLEEHQPVFADWEW